MKLKNMIFLKTFYFFAKFFNVPWSLEDFKSLKSWEQNKGAKKPVRKTSAKIFLIPGINSKELLSEKFLNKICKK